MMVKFSGLTLVLMSTVAVAHPVVAQQQPAPSATMAAEREAGRTAMAMAEKLGNAGQKGPDSDACLWATRAMSHFHAAAVAAGAIRRGAYWSSLSRDEMTAAAAAAGAPLVRNDRLREHLCRA
jgi:hypothetical protein